MTHPKRLYSPRTSRGQGKRRERGPLFFLCIFCLVGVLLGSIFAALGGRHPQFSDQLASYFQSVAQGTVPSVSFWSTVWDILCWPLLLVLLSFGPPGVVGVPCVLLIRCFLLSYACSSFVAMFGPLWPGMGGSLLRGLRHSGASSHPVCGKMVVYQRPAQMYSPGVLGQTPASMVCAGLLWGSVWSFLLPARAFTPIPSPGVVPKVALYAPLRLKSPGYPVRPFPCGW